MSKASIFLIAIFLFLNTLLYGQSDGVNREKYRIKISETNASINIDGILDEEVWKSVDIASHFQRVLPTDTGFAIAQTEVRLTYDKSNLYVGVICYDPTPGKRPVESLRRDFSFTKNDNFMLFLDTYNDQTNGFAFGISAVGAQTEGLQYDAIRVMYSWDIKWRSEVKNYDDRWVAEISIPFRSIRYLEGDKEWGINFGRLDLKTNEKSAWAPMPRQFPHCSLPYTGTLDWDKPLGKAGLRFSLIPYVTAKVTRDKQAEEDISWKQNAGFDTKIMLSSSMNLDLTVNPDYSQVEEDRQVTNLDRFELFFPERRQFFLENSDLFSSLGITGAQPFFSRRIGLNIPVIGGARLSGKIGNDWRIGVMDMQTGSKDEIPASNYAVAVLQRQVFSQSNIVGFMINKQVTSDYNDTLYSGSRFNRVAGLEYNLASPDNRWTGKTMYHQSFYPGASGNAAAMAANLSYTTQYLKASINQSWIGADYQAEVGYIRRKGYYQISPGIQYKFFPASSKIANHGPALEFNILFDPSLIMTDRESQLSYQIEWMNKSVFKIDASETFIKLQAPFDPTNTGGVPLPAGEEFNWKETGASFTSDLRKQFNFHISGMAGGFYNGTRWSMNGVLNYRVQPYGSLGIVATYNNLSMPSPYSSGEFILIGPRLDFTFTDKLFFTSFVQYNNQIDNLNLNLRFQWRFAPVSDLYIVYTENSFPADYSIKNRGLVLKLSYWFN
jgi:hypothetical protein